MGDQKTEANFDAIQRPRGRFLTAKELSILAARISEHPELWQHLVDYDVDHVHYAPLFDDGFVSSSLICWEDGHETTIHDHHGSSVAVAVISGKMKEEQYRHDRGKLEPTLVHFPGAGDVFSCEPADIHYVRGQSTSATIHVYSHPMSHMGVYERDENGLYKRRVYTTEEERAVT